MSLREEAFLDATNIESISGLSYGVIRPTKHASNPVAFPSAASTNQNYHTLSVAGATILSGGTTALAPLGANTGFAGIVPTYATSTDGVTFTQPNLAAVTWNGSTSNNVMYPPGLGDVSSGGTGKRWSLTAHFYHEDTAQWVVMMRGWDGNFGGYLYTSPNPYGPWTFASTVYADNPGFPSVDPGTLVQRADGRWLSYYQKMSAGYPQTGIPDGYYAGRRRDLGALLSDSTDLFGTWTDQGVVLSCAASSRQYYGATAWLSGETVCVGAWIFDGTDNVPAANTYNGTINRVHKIALYTGYTGLSLTLVDDDWLSSTGTISDWDGGEVLTNCFPVDVGNETRFYYAGDNATHHQNWVTQGNRRHMGLVSWGRNQLGKVSGTGSVVLDPITPGASAGMSVTVIAESGTVKVELLNASTGAVLSNYSQTDCDSITADGTEQTVTWRGSHVAPANAKIKVYVTSGELNYVTATTITGGLKLDTAGDSAWTQGDTGASVGRQITAYTARGARYSVAMTVYSAAGGRVRVAGTDASKWDVSLDGSTWAKSAVISAGRTDLYLSVIPGASDTALSCDIGVSP